jgi:hypothetical protein
MEAFQTYIAPHISKDMKKSDRLLAGPRVKIILEILFLSRSLYNVTIMPDSTSGQVTEDIPAASINTQELRFIEDELKAYMIREEACSQHFAVDLTPEKVIKLAEAVETKKNGVQIRQSLCVMYASGSLRIRECVHCSAENSTG